MKISEVEATQNQAYQKAVTPPPQLSDNKNQPKSEKDRGRMSEDPVVLRTSGGGGNFAVRKLEAVNSVMNMAADSIRTADDAMNIIGKTLGQMKTELVELVKQFPPYPPGSEERVESLKTFSSLRRQIDALSFPPDNEGAQELLSAPRNGDNARQQVDFGTGEIGISLKRQPVHSGPGGLDIPDLPMTADDAQLKDAITQLDRASQTLQHRRSSLAQDAQRITRL